MRRSKITILALLVICTNLTMASVPQSLKRAVELYNDGRWVESRLNLLEVKDDIKADNSAELEDVNFYLAMCAVELSDTEAYNYLEEFVNKYPNSTYINTIYFAKAMLACSNEDYTNAKELFHKVKYSLLTSSEREKYNIRMGYISFLERDYAEAEGYFGAIKEKSDIYHHALYYISYINYIEGDNIVARSGFKKLMYSDAYKAVAPFYLLQIEFNDGNYSEVLNNGESLYSRATAPRQRELARSMAEAAFKLEDFTKAIKYIEMYRNNEGVMAREENYILGFSLYRQVRYSEAMKYLRVACGTDDALTQNASYHLADCYLRSGDKVSASKSFAMAVNEAFSAEIAEDALFNYAKLQYELGNDSFNETINILTRYINKYPSGGKRYEQAKELLIATYYNSRDYNAAYQSIKELKNPDSDIRLALQRIALYRGLESYNAGDHQTATTQIKESLVVNISPKYSSMARFYLGEIDFANRDYQSALDNFNAYIASAPESDENYPLALYNIAYAKYLLGVDTEALGYYQRYIASAGDDTHYRADAYNRVGDIYYGKRQFTQAKDSYKHATWSTYEPRYYAMYQTAIIDGITGDYDAKIKRLKSIINSDKGDYIEDAMYELGRSYVAASDYRNGVETYKSFIAVYPSSTKYAQALSDLGLAYLNLGDKSTSLSYYDKAIKASPQSSVAKDALQGVREIYINDGNANGYFKYAASVGHSGDLNSMTKDSLSFASAQRLYINSEGRSLATINSLLDYINSYPQGYYTIDALYYLSDSYAKMDKNTEAITTLNQLVKRGSNQYSERIYARLSTLTYSEKQYSQSAEAYLKLYELSSREDVHKQSLAGYVDATLMENNNKSTLKMANYVMQQADVDAKLLIKVKHAKAKALSVNGDSKSALAIYKELSSDPLSMEGAESTYKVIEAAYIASNIDEAEQMIFNFSNSGTSHLNFLARTFIILGDIYVLRGDNFQARATYQSIIDGYTGKGDNIVEQAQAKINKLN